MSRTILLVVACVTVLLASAGRGQAALVSITLGDFSGSETVIDFNAIPNEDPITTQYTGSGVTFSGALVGLTNPGDTGLFNGSTIASNWIYSGPGNTGDSWTATFSAVHTRVGFHVETNFNDDVTIEAFLGGSSIGSINFPNPNGVTVDFIGVEAVGGGFDSITVTTAINDNGFFAMDDFRFEGAVAAVPEPSTLALLGMGVSVTAMGAVGRRYRGNRRAPRT